MQSKYFTILAFLSRSFLALKCLCSSLFRPLTPDTRWVRHCMNPNYFNLLTEPANPPYTYRMCPECTAFSAVLSTSSCWKWTRISNIIMKRSRGGLTTSRKRLKVSLWENTSEKVTADRKSEQATSKCQGYFVEHQQHINEERCQKTGLFWLFARVLVRPVIYAGGSKVYAKICKVKDLF